MPRSPKLFKIEGSFLDAVECAIKTAPPPKDTKEAKARKKGLATVKRVRKTRKLHDPSEQPRKSAGRRQPKKEAKKPR